MEKLIKERLYVQKHISSYSSPSVTSVPQMGTSVGDMPPWDHKKWEESLPTVLEFLWSEKKMAQDMPSPD